MSKNKALPLKKKSLEGIMKTELEQFPVKNPNPVLSLGKDGIVLYSNEAGEPLLHEWSVVVGEKLPQHIENIVHRVISRNRPERIEVKVGERVYLLAFHSLAGEECVNIYGFDISDQKELEGKLRENEEKYRKLFEYIQEIFFIADDVVPDEAGKPVDYRFAEANQTLEPWMRVSPEEITGNMKFGIHPGLDTFWIRNYDRVALTGKHAQSDHHADGQEQHYQVPLHRIKQGRFATIFRDITDSKQVDSALREDEELLPFAFEPSHIGVWDLDLVDHTVHRLLEHDRIFGYKQAVKAQWESEMMYRMLFKHSIDAIVLADPRDGGKILSANPAACSMLGWSEEELIGKGRDVMFDSQDPVLSTLFAERAHSGSLRAQLTYRRKDGTTFTGEVSIASFTDSNGEPRTVDIIRDITERKKSEEALQKVYDSLEVKVREHTAELEAAYKSLKESERHLAEAQRMAHIGNWEWNILTNKIYWSEEMFRIFGRSPQKLAPDHKEFLNYIYPDDRDSAKNAIKGAINGEPYSIVYRIVLADGEERTIYKQSEVILDGENNPIRIKGIAQDITERKKSEEALANIETARKQEIHHRIKNNLQVISSLLDLQAEQFKNRESIKNSEVLEAFRESQARVISMALIHEELYKGDGLETLNFSPYIEELAESLFRTYRIGNSDIRLKLDLEQNISFDMDTAVPLGIIVNELVSNSLKHAFPDGETGEITIKLHREENREQINSPKKGCSITFILSVSDNGVGIAGNLDIRNLDSLGLQLVTTLVDQLNGELELKRNNGTEFTIMFTVTEKTHQVLTPASQLMDNN
jgi:PAS domain S-box-containing protein